MPTRHPDGPRPCDGLTRRESLRVGGLSALGLTLPELLRRRAAAGDRQEGTAKACIVLFLMGGPPQHSTWDPKPDAPPEVRGEFPPVDTNVPGIRIGSVLPNLTRHAGVSNHGLAQWQACERALGGEILSNQVRFSLVHREPERELLPWAQRTGRIVIAYSPLGQGLLSGKYQSAPPANFRRFRGDFTSEGRARRAPLIEALRDIAAERGVTAAQVALAWLVRKPNVVAIPGASSVRQLEENAAAADLTLSDGDVSRLDSLSA